MDVVEVVLACIAEQSFGCRNSQGRIAGKPHAFAHDPHRQAARKQTGETADHLAGMNAPEICGARHRFVRPIMCNEAGRRFARSTKRAPRDP